MFSWENKTFVSCYPIAKYIFGWNKKCLLTGYCIFFLNVKQLLRISAIKNRVEGQLRKLLMERELKLEFTTLSIASET